MPMPADEVLSIVQLLDGTGLFVSVDGGWGVDALFGRETRMHDDLDLVVDVEQVQAVRQALAPRGYRLHLNDMPTRFVLRAGNDLRIDAHPMYFDETGYVHQRLPGGKLFTCRILDLRSMGWIDGESVQCLSPELQLAAHTGYPPDETDRSDVRLLCRVFDLPLPSGYGPQG